MPVSTRDLQRKRRASRFALEALAAVTEDSQFFCDGRRSVCQPTISTVTTPPVVDETMAKSKKPLLGRYRWRMSHYFYIHLLTFIFNGFFGGLIIFLIENYSSSRNSSMVVTYLDAWFTTVSTICSCGLTTIDFAQLSRASQLMMMGFSFFSSFAFSTLPALALKANIHRGASTAAVDNVNDDDDDKDRFVQNLPLYARTELARLPTPQQLRYRAYVTCLLLILILCFTIYLIGFLSIGIWLQKHRSPAYLSQNNQTLSPWYISSMLTLFSFNQNGLTPFSTSLSRYVDDVFLNVIIILVKCPWLETYYYRLVLL